MFKPYFQLFTFSFILLRIFVKGQMDSDDMKRKNQLNSDVTYDFTDNDFKLALSDLSLNDLKLLQELIDSADYNYLDYQDNSLRNGKFNSLNSYEYNNQEFDYVMDYPDQDDNYNNNFEPENSEYALINYPEHPQNLIRLLPEAQRTKRNGQKRNINDEYIKQLDNSFPQNEQQSYYNDVKVKKPHIRVKRN